MAGENRHSQTTFCRCYVSQFGHPNITPFIRRFNEIKTLLRLRDDLCFYTGGTLKVEMVTEVRQGLFKGR